MTGQKQTPDGPSRERVWHMFDRIAPRYDLLNRLLSGGRDVAWRNRLADMLPDRKEMRVLDIATGTGDVILTLFDKNRHIVEGVGIDMAEKMLDIGRRKVADRGLADAIDLITGDAVNVPCDDQRFDATSIAFGIRNVVDINRALTEMRRVLNPGGRALILEFSLPRNRLIRSLYLFYFRHILPRIGGLISGDAHAYRYLNETVETFPYGEDFCRLMKEAGFRNVTAVPLTLGIATIYRGDK